MCGGVCMHTWRQRKAKKANEKKEGVGEVGWGGGEEWTTEKKRERSRSFHDYIIPCYTKHNDTVLHCPSPHCVVTVGVTAD